MPAAAIALLARLRRTPTVRDHSCSRTGHRLLSFTVTSNAAYWGGAPSIGTVEVETIPNETSISSALQAGSIQMGLFADPTVVGTIPTSYKVQKVMNLSYRALQLQDTTGIFHNANLRRGRCLRDEP